MDVESLRSLPWRRPRATTVLALRGRDARDLLHRLSTADLTGLPEGAARAALFCDFRGRLLHRAIACGGSDGARLLRDDAPAADLAAWLDRHLFREDCRLEDRGGDEALLLARGPAAAAWSDANALPDGAGRPLEGGVQLARVAPDLLWAWGTDAALAGVAGEARAWADSDERARIESAWPAHGHEIRDDFHPYEVGLAHEVHLAKGCYTGQEALQRLVTYGSARRRLVRVRGAGAPPGALPLELWDGEAGGGRLTSAAPAASGWVGLAVLPRAWSAETTRVGPSGSAPGWSFEIVPETRPQGRPLSPPGGPTPTRTPPRLRARR